MPVLNERYSLRMTPLKMVFISGMPEPMALGETMWTKPVLNRMKTMVKRTQATYWRIGLKLEREMTKVEDDGEEDLCLLLENRIEAVE